MPDAPKAVTTPTAPPVLQARDLLIAHLKDHEARCGLGPRCRETANVMGFLAHCLGAKAADMQALPKYLVYYDLECTSKGGCGFHPTAVAPTAEPVKPPIRLPQNTRCAVPACRAAVDPAQTFCSKCWLALPRNVREAFYVAYRAGDPAGWRNAVAAAVRHANAARKESQS